MPSIYLIYGEDEYQVTNKSREIINGLLPEEERTFGLEVIDAAADTIDVALKALKACFEALQTVGFFSERKVTWFRDVSFLTDNVVGRNEDVKKAVNEQLVDLLKAGLPEGQTLIVSSPKVHKAKKFYKACKEIAELHEFAVSAQSWQNEKDVADFMRSQLGVLGIKMDRNAETVFLEKVGTNSRHIVNELGKLAVYIGDRKEAKVADVEAITSASKTSVSWDLADAVGARNLKKAINIARQLLFQKESAIGMVAGLNARIRDLMICRQAMDNDWLSVGGKNAQWMGMSPEIDAMFNEMEKDPRKTHPYRLGLLARQAANFRMIELRRCQHAIMQTHQKLVGSAMPDELALELLLVRILA
jgi:DNA polymerase-3 subunit delta